MKTIKENVASKTYEYTGTPIIGERTFLMPGDVLYHADNDPETGDARLVSSRGHELRFGKQFCGPDGIRSSNLQKATPENLDALHRMAFEQNDYRDADAYMAEGDRAVAAWSRHGVTFSIEKSGDHATLVYGVPEDGNLPSCGRDGFGPAPRSLESELDRQARLSQETGLSPLARIGAVVRGTAGRLSGKGGPDPEAAGLDMTALGLMTRAMQPTVRDVARGSVVAWKTRGAARGMDGAPVNTHYGLVTGDDGEHIGVMEMFDPADSYMLRGTVLAEVPAGGPILENDWVAAPDITHEFSGQEFRSKGGAVMYGASKAPEETVAALESQAAEGPARTPSATDRVMALAEAERAQQADAGHGALGE